MAATSTLKNVADQLVEESAIGMVLPSFTGTTTTLTLTTTGSSEIRGPFTGRKIAIGSPIIITAGGTPGEDTYVSDWNPSTGVITVSPAITTGATDAVLLYKESDIDHGDHVMKAVSRAINNRLARWQLTPLTFVPDGDLLGTTVTDYWTAAANGTAAYVSAQSFPAGSAVDAAGDVGLSRVLQLTSTGATSLVGNGIRAQHTANNRLWYFHTAIRLVSGTGTATFSIFDNTNSADITPSSVMHGNDTLTMTTTTFGDFMVCEGTLQQPATCDELAPKLTLSATTMVAQMTPVVMFPLGAMRFPLPSRIVSKNYVGNYHYATTLSQPGGLESLAFSEPLTVGGRTHSYSNQGDHLTVTFNFRPTRAIYFDEYAGDADITTMTATTSFPLDQVVKWAKFELFKMLYYRESMRASRISSGINAGQPTRSIWLPLAKAAQREAGGSDYEADMMNVVGRVS